MYLSRAQGCLVGQLAGDALGSLVEFQTPEQIRYKYPDGVRHIADGGTWNTIAGQPTDDSELALALARTLVAEQTYNSASVLQSYQRWLSSKPFDCGLTISSGLRGQINPTSQANGAMMRISPLGIFGSQHSLTDVARWSDEDAALTHPHPICRQANILFASAIAFAIAEGPDPSDLHGAIRTWARHMNAEKALQDAIEQSEFEPPEDFVDKMGWVLIAFPNALWQLQHAKTAEDGVVDTVMRGGDTDTNAAICGALLGAVHGLEAIPSQWLDSVQGCQPRPGDPGVYQPRPEEYWPHDALALAERLVTPKASK